MNIAEKKRVSSIKDRIRRLVDERKIAVSSIAMKSGVEIGTIKALYENSEFSKRTIAESTAGKIEKGLDAVETSLGMVKRCTSCGKEYPIGWFHRDASKKDGLHSTCKPCTREQVARSKRKKKRTDMNNNTEKAMTADIVRNVKAEDKRDVESKFMAPYFGITPKQLDEIRKGIWDKLLLTPKTPERADSVLQAVEMLRDEVAELRREVEAVLIEFGVEVNSVK